MWGLVEEQGLGAHRDGKRKEKKKKKNKKEGRK